MRAGIRKPKTLQITDPGEAAFLAQVVVRRVRPDELARCRELVCEHHYLHTAELVGEQLWYVAGHQGRWLALLGWAAAYHLQGRDTWIGWHALQRRARLGLLANSARFCLLTPTSEHPNLASHVLGQNLQCLAADWQEAYGHPILAVESFVDTQLFRGTCYRATGWRAVGGTAGCQRVAQDFYQVHDRPKQLFVRELVKHAARTLRARELPAGQTLLQRLELDGRIALLNALHTPVEMARAIVQAGGGGFVLVVKGNQPTLLARAKNLLPEDFSPAGGDGRTRPRPGRVARHPGPGGHPGTDGVSAGGAVGAG